MIGHLADMNLYLFTLVWLNWMVTFPRKDLFEVWNTDPDIILLFRKYSVGWLDDSSLQGMKHGEASYCIA